MIGGFQSVLCVSVFQGSLLVIIIMIDGSEKRNCEGGFWTLEFAFLWKAQYEPQLQMAFQCSSNLSIPASFCIWRVIHTFLWRLRGVSKFRDTVLIIGWFSNRTGTSFYDRKARRNDQMRLTTNMVLGKIVLLALRWQNFCCLWQKRTCYWSISRSLERLW